MERAGTVVILAAGQGTRMRSPLPKVLYGLCGRPMLGYVLDQARTLEPERILVVTGHGGEAVRSWLATEEQDERITCVTQPEQKGTGHAVMVCADELRKAPGPVVVLYGDMPLLRAESLAALCATRGAAPAAALTALPDRPRGFGRILREQGILKGIVEERDATPEQLELPEVNVGVYCFDRETLLDCLPRLTDENAQGEYYLTDVLAMVVAAGHEVASSTLVHPQEGIGINTLEHLSEARQVLQERILLEHMAGGVFVEDPATTYIDHGVQIGSGTRVLPCTVIRRGVKVGENCEVGPFTHLRVGTVLEDGAEVGNFTEAKQATIGCGTKAKHLTYLGDVTIGAGANIGAGTIVANYDGKNKHRTAVGDRAFVGSGSILIAPCTVGEGALTGAGAVVTRNTQIPTGEAWIGVPARPLRRESEKQKSESSAQGDA